MKTKAALVALIIILAALTLCGCTFVHYTSPYELAVENGFSGTESEWLESLKGEKGDKGNAGLDGKDGADGQNFNVGYTVSQLYEEACARGYTKTFLEFVDEYFASSDGGELGIVNVANNQIFSCCIIRSPYVDPTDLKNYASYGSGIFYSVDKEKGDAIVVTNYHVVYDENDTDGNKVFDTTELFLYGDYVYSNGIAATYIGGSAKYDLAVLSVKGSEIIKRSDSTAIDFADSDKAVVGDTVVAIGNPEGKGFSITTGILSVASENVEMKNAMGDSTIMREMRIDASVNHGNSGGGLFDKNGKLLGLVNAKVIKTDVENISYAIPSVVVKNLTENVLENYVEGTIAKVERPYLGVTIQVDSAYGQYNAADDRLEIIEKVVVKEFSTVSLVDGLLKVGDVLKSYTLHGKTVQLKRSYMLVDALLKAKVDDKLTLTYIRDGAENSVTVTLTEASFKLEE